MKNLDKPTSGTVLFGTQLTSAKNANKINQEINKKLNIEHPINIGSVYIAHAVENQHFAICGTTGSGKTQAINSMLLTIRARGKKAIIADAGGEFISHFYRAGDKILNPFDQRSASWSPFAEIRQDYDCSMIAKLTIPDGEGSSKEWNFYAQTLLAECLLAMHKLNNHSLKKLLYYVSASTQEELAELLKGTLASILTLESNQKMLSNTRAVIANYINAWRYLPDNYNFSIRQWLQGENDQSWLFISYRDDQVQLLVHFVSMCLGMAITENLCLPKSDEREIWHIYDEVDTLGRVESLKAGLTKLRKYGGRVVMGLQTISQLQKTYGRFEAQTFLANISTKLILRAGDNETASYFSKEIGEQEIVNQSQSYTDTSGKHDSDSSTESYHNKRQLVFMPNEIVQFARLTGLLKTSTTSPVIVRLSYVILEKLAANYQSQNIS